MIQILHATDKELKLIAGYLNMTINMPADCVICRAKELTDDDGYFSEVVRTEDDLANGGLPALDFGSYIDKYADTVERVKQAIVDFRAGYKAANFK